MIDRPGVYADIPAAQYHADDLCPEPSLSCSVAELLLSRSPAHAKAAHPRLRSEGPEEDDGKFAMGSAVHELLLGDERIRELEFKDYKTQAARNARADAIANGMTPLLTHQLDEAVKIADRVRKQIDAHPELRGALAYPTEQTVIWREDGFWCRCRPDVTLPGYLRDLKLTGTAATPEGWASRHAFAMGYDFRAAWYLRGWEKATGEAARYQFIVIEDEEPYALAWFEAPESVLDAARRKVDAALAIWSRCLKLGIWPAYTTQLQWLEEPKWMEFQTEATLYRAMAFTGQQLDALEGPVDPPYVMQPEHFGV
jgi:hypothetical protein